MIRIPDPFEADIDISEEVPFDANLVQDWISANATVIQTKIRASLIQDDLLYTWDIQLTIPLDIPAWIEPAISITEMAIQNPGLFQTLMETTLDSTTIFNWIQPYIISAEPGHNDINNRDEACLTFTFYDKGESTTV